MLNFNLDLSPEMVNSLPYDYSVDVWSMGIMTYEMVTGYSPFTGFESEILKKIKSYEGISSIRERLESVDASKELLDFIEKTLTFDHRNRIEIEDVLNHQWFKVTIFN